MPYFESIPMLPEHAEIINLKRIVELSPIPEVGPSPLDPKLTAEVRYTNALSTLEKSTAVFEEAFYQDAVFAEEIPETILDQELIERARFSGVPESHLPENVLRNPPPCPPAPIVTESLCHSRSISPTSPEDRTLSLSSPRSQSQASFRPRTAQSVDSSHRAPPRPSLSIPTNQFFRTFRSRNPSTVSTTSAASIATTSSQLSSGDPVLRRKTKRRDSLMNFFRRENKFKPQAAPLDETTAWSPSSPSDCEAPSLQSARTNDQSSVQSTTLSSRTSTSSFADLSTLSWIDSRTVQKAMKTARFLALQIRCQNEAKRFIDFAQHQRVALPLFVGRTRVYLESRMVQRRAESKRKQQSALEELDNKHLEQELAEMDEQKSKVAEETTKNATALKHMNRRLSLLGENATLEERQRIDEEMLALEKLAVKQERDMQKLLRLQNREKLDLQRHQLKESDDLEVSMKEDYEAKVRDKQEELQKNMNKLEQLIHQRTIRMVGRWYLQLQIFKREDKETSHIKGPLPLSILGLPEEFGPYSAAYH